MNQDKLIDDQLETTGSVLTDEMKAHLTETRKWGLFFVILGLLFCGLMIVAVVGMVLTQASNNAAELPFAMTWIYFFYGLLVAFYVLPIYYLIKYNSNAEDAVKNDSSQALESSMKYMKLLFRSTGVMTIAFIVIYIIVIIVAIGNGGSF